MRTRADVFVTGVGAATRLGVGARATLEAWRAGTIATGPLDPFEPGELEGLRDPRRKAKGARLVACAAFEAWKSAGLDPAAADGADAFFVASSLGCLDHSREFNASVIRRSGPSPMLFTESVLNAAAGHLAIERALHRGGHAVSTLLYDAFDAFRLAVESVASGRAEAAIVAGWDGWIAELEPIFLRCGGAPPGGDPAGCAPFAAAQGGFRLGEAAGALFLESRASVARRGGRPIARVAGVEGAFRPDEPGEAIEAAAAAVAHAPAPRWLLPSANGGVCEEIEEPWLERVRAGWKTPPGFASLKPSIGEAFAGSAALHLAFAALAGGGEELPFLPAKAPATGAGAWAVGADPVGSITVARFEAP